MDFSSPPSIISPPRRLQSLSQSENEPPRARVPRQTSVSSASRIPPSPTRRSMSNQVASAVYVNQFHALIEHQREVHSEERALWYTERADLHDKIAQLESSLRRYRIISSSEVTSPIDKNAAGSNSAFGSLAGTDGSRQTSLSGTGEEVWRGPRPDVLPTRTFSDASAEAKKPKSRLPSITEDITPDERRGPSEDVPETRSLSHKPSITGFHTDKSIDGINFKTSGLPDTKGKSIMTPQSPSPQCTSPSRVSPGTIEMPPPGLIVPYDQYTRDAGHTPLARRTFFNTDRTGSPGSSNAATPTQAEVDRPPLAPHVTITKLPSERSDSYFPATHDSPDNTDPALSGPLGLTNDKDEDKNFLNRLDSKLLEAAKSESVEPAAVAGSSETSTSAPENGKDLEQLEHEPKLRIKRSMNFGSAFGAKNPGRGL